MQIHSKEALKDYIHSVHDYIRNSGAGYGMTALKIFNVFYSLKILESKAEYLGFSKFCEWSKLKKKLKETEYGNKTENGLNFREEFHHTINELRNICLGDSDSNNPIKKEIIDIYDYVLDYEETELGLQIKNVVGDALDRIRDQADKKIKLKNIAYFIYHQIPEELSDEFIRTMFIMIDELIESLKNYKINNSNNNEVFDIKGKIYEYFVGREEKQISDLGQYFTERYITSFIMEELNIKLDPNGSVYSMIDPFAGSGGMTISYVKYIDDKFKPNWKLNDNYNKITHCDMAEDVVKIAGIEFYSICNEFPSTTQFFRTNTFKYENFEKYHYVISNVPYGGDKISKSEQFLNRESIINYNIELIDLDINDIINELNITDKKDLVNFKKDFESVKRLIEKEILLLIQKNKILSLISNNKIINIDIFNNLVKQCFNTFTIKYKYSFETNIDLINKITRLHIQNIILKCDNKDEIKKEEEKKVNYNTCSNTIKKWSMNLIYDYTTYTKKQILKEIETMIKKDIKEENKLLKSQITNLNKLEDKIKKDLLTKYKENNIGDDEITNINDKEACSFILLMGLLEKDGTCVGVLKEGVFFDSKYSKIRCYLIENFNVLDIISVDADSFENTTTKTSIIIFKNNGKTKSINFSRLKVNRNDKSTFKYDLINGTEYIQHKDKINLVEKENICQASYKEISKINFTWNKNNEPQFDFTYSLNYKDYMKDETFCPEGYELVKMKDLIDYKSKSKRPASFANNDGKYRFYTSSDTIKKCTECDYNSDKPLLIFGTGGKGSLFFDKYFSCSADNFVCKAKNDIINETLEYIYQYIKFNWKNFIFKMFNGSTLGHINQTRLNEFQIPIPKDISKLKPQLKTLSKFHSIISDLTEQIPQKEKEICELIKELTENGEECVDWDECKLKDICELKDGYNFYRNEMDSRKKFIKDENYPLIKNNGGVITDYVIINEKYDKYIVNRGDILIGTAGTCGRIIKSEIKKAYHVHNMPKFLNLKINKNYLYYYLQMLINNDFIKKNTSGSVLGTLKMETIINIKIRILKDKILTKHNIQDKFDEIDKLKEELEETKIKYQDEINKLMEPFGNNEKLSDDNESIKSNMTEEEIELPEELKNIPTITKIKKESEKSDSETKSEQHQNKFDISDLVEIPIVIKDYYSYWYNTKTEEIYSFNKKNQMWKLNKSSSIKEHCEKEVELIKSDLKKLFKSKSDKLVKSNKILLDINLSDEKKNKSLKQQITSYKTKLNNKSISKSDENSSDLEKELENKFNLL